MDDANVFYLGLFVTILLFSGVAITAYEFKKMYRQPENEVDDK